MEFFLTIFFGIPLLFIVFRVLIADATEDNENKIWKKGLAVFFLLMCGSGLAINGLSNEEGLASFALLTSFLLALWKNKND